VKDQSQSEKHIPPVVVPFPVGVNEVAVSSIGAAVCYNTTAHCLFLSTGEGDLGKMRRNGMRNRRSIGPAFYKNVRVEATTVVDRGVPFDSGESIEMSFSRGTPPGAEWICSGRDIPILGGPVCPSRVLMFDRVFVLLKTSLFTYCSLVASPKTVHIYTSQNFIQESDRLFSIFFAATFPALVSRCAPVEMGTSFHEISPHQALRYPRSLALRCHANKSRSDLCLPDCRK
jgi:hypothetical protein